MTSAVPKSALLATLLRAFERRGKAIRHKTSRLVMTTETEPTDGAERLNIDVEAFGRPAVQVRLSIWQDGQLYLGAHRGAPGSRGWEYAIELTGRLRPRPAVVVVRSFEATLDAVRPGQTGYAERLLRIWSFAHPALERADTKR